MATDRPTITLRPDPAGWRRALGASPARAPDRHALGLPADRPVVMSGHQPTLWHAGILAKLLAVCELARAADAHAAWIVPDMDEADPTTTRLPDGRGDRLRERAVRVLDADPPVPGVPAGALPPSGPAPADPDLPGLADALAAFRDEPSMAMQAGRAVVRLACERFGLPEPTVLSASDLCRTCAWTGLLGAIAADPRACVEAYNAAVRANPDAEVRALAVEKSRVELPLWRVRPGLPPQPRLPVFSDHLDAVPPDELRPRALAMTAVVRAALADLFVHGLGGERYDRVTEAWLAGWTGAPAWELCPTGVATADARPDLGVDPDALPDAARARWLAHHARHSPGVLGDEDAARAKARLLARIGTLKAEGRDPAPAFAELQALLRAVRERHADRLAALDADADRAARLSALRLLAADRTWPWPTLPADTLDDLHAQIRRAIDPATISRCAASSSCS